ncbi:MAG: carboxypeptidase regulatory-like domain-containing protein [Planctomycetota bacterium]
MKSRITKLAAAAVITVAVLIGIYYLSGPFDVASVAFADVVQPLLSTETGSFKMTIDVSGADLEWINYGNEPVQTIEVVFAGPGRTRWNIPTGEVLIANMQEGKLMILSPAQKQATVMQVGPPGLIPEHNRFNKLLGLKPLIQHALDTEDDSVEFLGERQIEGVTAIGYYITSPQHHGNITIWADVETKWPIRIEQSMGTQTAVISDIIYNVELVESLFSVELPEGYSSSTSEEDKEPEFVVTGTIKDAATGEPIGGARVSDDGYGPKPYKGTITDSEGKYSYRTWPEEHRIKAEAPGYKPQLKGITGLFHMENEDEKVIDFALEPE